LRRVTTAAAHPKGTLAATILGSSLAFIDGSVVNVALPAIEHDLASSGASGASIGWLINAYLLTLGALVLVGGVAGDRYGRKRMFLAGIAVFAAASAACALAPGFGWLLAVCALQGVGAALLVPASLAILGAAFEGEARGRAVGTWAAASSVAGALGPLLGGWLVDAVGWRAIFLINLPIAAAAAWLAWRQVDESRSDDTAPLDLVGAALATVGLGLATFGLTALAANGAAHGGALAGGAAVAAGVVALVAFVFVEARLGRRAMMPLALFGTRPFVGVTLLTPCLYAALSGMVVLLLPYLLIASAGWAATAAAAALLPLSLVMGLGSRAAGKLAERVGTRRLLTVGTDRRRRGARAVRARRRRHSALHDRCAAGALARRVRAHAQRRAAHLGGNRRRRPFARRLRVRRQQRDRARRRPARDCAARLRPLRPT
jgi:EmrB/QacA subfamily drug resistance transporter